MDESGYGRIERNNVATKSACSVYIQPFVFSGGIRGQDVVAVIVSKTCTTD